MASLNSLFNNMSETVISGATDELLIINPDTRQIDLPGNELVFGVESDQNGERKYFQCSRYVGNNIDLASCFVRVNYRNANGEVDFDLVDDLTVDGDNVVFSWEVSGKAVAYRGQVNFVVCFTLPGTKPYEWHTTVTTGIALEGLEPDSEAVEAASADGITQILALVEAQTAAVEAVGAEQVGWVETTGAEQIIAVEQAASDAEAASVAEIEAKGVNTLASIPDDYTALSEAVNTIERGMAPGIVCEAEGSVITLDDASNMAMQGMRIFGKSTQDGTPTPEAPVEIVSLSAPLVNVCGKNLLNAPQTIEKPESGYNYDLFTKTAGQSTAVPLGSLTSLPYVEAGKSYYFSYKLPDGAAPLEIKVMAVNDDGTIGDDTGAASAILAVNIGAFTPAKNSRVTVRVGTMDAATIYDMQLELGDTATEYEPYTGHTLQLANELPGIPVNSGGNYTDADGQQWICDEVDLARGVYVQRVSEKTLYDYVDKYCVYSNNSTHSDTILRFDFGYAFGAKVQTLVLCNRLKYSYAHGDAGAVARTTECVSSHSASDIISIFINESRLASKDIAGFKAYLLENETVVQYALATPVETPLSETELAAWRGLHTNKQNTTILNDAGAHMAVEYVADTKLYIDKKIAALTA